MAKKKTTKVKTTTTTGMDDWDDYVKKTKLAVSKATNSAIIMTIFYSILPFVFFMLYELTQANLLFSLLPVVTLGFIPLLFFVFYDYFYRYITDHDNRW